MSLNLRQPCEHDQYEPHPGRHSRDCLDEPSLAPCVCDSVGCPGGRVLTDAEAVRMLFDRYEKAMKPTFDALRYGAVYTGPLDDIGALVAAVAADEGNE